MGPFFSPRAPGSETARLAVRTRQRIVGAPNCVSRQFIKLSLLLLILFSSAFFSAPPVLAQTPTSSLKRVLIRRNSDQPKLPANAIVQLDRKSTRLNSSHLVISYAFSCLKKK